MFGEDFGTVELADAPRRDWFKVQLIPQLLSHETTIDHVQLNMVHDA